MNRPDFLFDIGNVILFFDFRLFAEAIAPKSPLTAEEIFTEIEDPRNQMEAEGMETDEFVQLASKHLRYTGTPEEFIHAWQNIFTVNEPVAQLIRQLDQAGARLCLLSNTNQMHVDFFEHTRAEIFDRFTGGRIYSHLVGCGKPDPKIYEITRAELNLDPANTVYIDDAPANAEAGIAAGFQTIHYTGQDLTSLLG